MAGSFRCDCPSGSVYDAARRLCKGKYHSNGEKSIHTSIEND